MSLRNKKTGEISTNPLISVAPYTNNVRGCNIRTYRSIGELNKEWEDYEPKEPLIKDEKVRGIVRALFDVWGVEDVKIDSNKYFLVTTIEAFGKGWKLEIPNININGVFKPTDLCGEEEE